MPMAQLLVRTTLAVACLVSTVLPAQPVPKKPTRTFAADSFWIRTWMRGGSKEEDLLTESRQVIAVGGLVLVLDEGTRELLGFDATTGRSRFSLKARGEGPGEFRRPARIAPTQSGFAVLDHATARITAFDTVGRMQWDAPVTSVFETEGLCLLPSGQILSKLEGAVGSILRSDSAGRAIGRSSLEAGADPKAGYGWSGIVTGPDAHGNCIVARRYGSEWYVVTPAGAVMKHQYVVHSAEAVVNVTVKPGEREGTRQMVRRSQTVESDPSVMDAMVLGDTLIVRAGGAGRDQLVLLDYYHIRSGRYLYSRRLPGITNAITVGSNGAFFALIIGQEYSTIYALRTSRTPPPKAPRNPQPGS